MADFPEAAKITPFYVESVSLVDYLVRLKGAKAFVLYLREAPRRGYEEALQRHYSIKDASEHQTRMDRYTTLAAQEQFDRGKRASVISLVYLPALTFFRSYFLKLGFLDGIQGLAISYFSAHYVFLKTIKLWELHNGKRASQNIK